MAPRAPPQSGNLYGRGVRRYLCPPNSPQGTILAIVFTLYIYLPWTLVDLIHCHRLISKAEIITAFGAGQKLVLSYTSPINLPQGSALASSSTICWRYEKRVKVCWSNARATPECHHLASRSDSDLKWPVGNVTQHSHQLYCHHLHCTSLCCSGDPTQCNPVYCKGLLEL